MYRCLALVQVQSLSAMRAIGFFMPRARRIDSHCSRGTTSARTGVPNALANAAARAFGETRCGPSTSTARRGSGLSDNGHAGHRGDSPYRSRAFTQSIGRNAPRRRASSTGVPVLPSAKRGANERRET
jgi:hypothetical protein